MKHQSSTIFSLITVLPLATTFMMVGQFNSSLDTGEVLKARAVFNTQDTVFGISFASDGNSLWCVAGNRGLLWDLSSAEPKKVMKYHSNAEYGNPDWHMNLVYAMAASPDGKTIATADQRGVVKLWDAATGAVKATGKGKTEEIRSLAFRPNGAALVGGSREVVYIWDAATLATRATLDVKNGGWIKFVAYSPDGNTLFTGGSSSKLSLWDANTGNPKRVIEISERDSAGAYEDMSAAALSPNGSLIATGGNKSGYVLDVATGKLLGKLPHEGHISGVAFSRDGRFIATSSQDMTVKVWDAATRKIKATMQGHTTIPSRAIAFSPTGKTIATGSSNEIRLWNLP